MCRGQGGGSGTGVLDFRLALGAPTAKAAIIVPAISTVLRSAMSGTSVVTVSANAKVRAPDHLIVATGVSVGCSRHSPGSAGVFGRSAVVGTTCTIWKLRFFS